MSGGLQDIVWQLTVMTLGAFASEDLTCLSAGLLIHSGQLSWPIGVAGCFLGIFVSDLALWLLGRGMDRGLLSRRWVRRWLPEQRLASAKRSFGQRAWVALLAARFLPGTRLPLYVAAGTLGQPLWQFALGTGLAALLWTPVVVLGVAVFGERFVEPFKTVVGRGWPAFLLASLTVLLAVRVLVRLCTTRGRARLWAGISKCWRCEFGPSWLFYVPLVPWLGYLALRYRSFTVWTAANPGIPSGGVVGESKFAILEQLPDRWIVPSAVLMPGDGVQRLAHFQELIANRDWQFPLILKPDVGQRGAGVKLVRTMADAAEYLRTQPVAIVVQTYHAGPFEAGVFYVRIPGEQHGRIFSITDKRFPMVVGDGQSTLEELVWAHSRFRMQASTFLTRHEANADRVLEPGESFALALAGNHCQGTKFLDGARLITLALERRFDEIAKHFDGFFFGRFDVRYADVGAFMDGHDFAIVELNGVTSESTNLYDPRGSIFSAYRILIQQWSVLFRIGDANRQRGHCPTSLASLAKLLWSQVRSGPSTALAD
jgi:membrane protein DedA with SNARE-associated domain